MPGLLAFLMLLSTFPLEARDKEEIIYAYRNYSPSEPAKMLLVGQVRNKMKVAEKQSQESPYGQYDARLDQVTVKVENSKGIKVGQKLYIVDKEPFHKEFRDAIIVGEITVTSIFFSPFYGWALTGQGILLRVREGFFVARTLETENLDRAFALKRKGDAESNRGEGEKAIASYYSALEMDSTLPEAHSSLGALYAKQDQGVFPSRSLSEFEQAYRHKANFKNTFDEIDFYKQYMTTLNDAYQIKRMESSREKGQEKLLNKIIDVSDQFERVSPGNIDNKLHRLRARFSLMQALSFQSGAKERKAYDASVSDISTLLQELREPLLGYSSFDINMNAYANADAKLKLYSFPIGDYHRIAVLYYTDRLKGTLKEEEKSNYIEWLKFHRERFFRFGKRDREVENTRREFP